MRYCIDYGRPELKQTRFFKEADEITISFRRTDNTLIQFIELHKDKRINIKITDKQDFFEHNCMDMFWALKEKFPDTEIVLYVPKDEDFIAATEGFPRFFAAYCSDWDSLYYLISLRPTDIFIVEGLGFDIKRIAKILHSHDINVRCFANVAQSADPDMPPMLRFFIRPEDVEMYEPYIDTIEFFKTEKSLNTLYKIYAIDKKWDGPLSLLIHSFDDTAINGSFLLPVVMNRRMSCDRECLKGHKCRMCTRAEELAKLMNKRYED